MTTKPAVQSGAGRFHRLPPDFALPDPGPMPDAMQQERTFIDTADILHTHFSSQRSDVLVSGNTILCYDPDDLNARVLPDCYVTFGVDPHAVIARNGYILWEVGKPPDFALEIASESTARRDVRDKPGIYARIGIGEYWRFDPSGGDYYGQPLAGDRLTNGTYEPIPLTTDSDGMIWGYSTTLGLRLCAHEDGLRFYDPASGEFLRDMREEHAARITAENAQQAAEMARQIAEDTLAQERARIQELEERLRRLEQRDKMG